MSVDLKDIQILISRITTYTVNSCFRFVQNYPLLSGVFFFLFVLYLFLPSVFYFAIYSSPLLVCTAVFIRFYLYPKSPLIQNARRNDQAGGTSAKSSSHADVTAYSSSEAQTVLQRDVKAKNEESDAEAAKKKESGPSSSRNVSTDENISGLGETSKSYDSYDGQQDAKLESGREPELESSSSEEDDEEEVQEGVKKAVEWNEDDQKNLMDLGLSELERNRRLESLIARRRARKLFKMHTEKRLIEKVIALSIARGNPFDVASARDEQIPGSAPSVLLPNWNPFDLPYDSNEEKPDLTEDSFQQEFMPVHQKDMAFCRHESFTLEPSFPLEKMQDHHEGGTGESGFRRQLGKGEGNHGQKVENLSSRGGETMRHNVSVTDLVTHESQSSNQVTDAIEQHKGARTSGTETKDENVDSNSGNGGESPMEMNGTKESNGDLSLSSEDDENIVNANKTGFKFPEVSVQCSLRCPLPKARAANAMPQDSSPHTLDRTTTDDHFFEMNKGSWHTPTNSIASDMQVEVSEIGSPPAIGDESGSSSNGESLTYDGDIEKEITSGSEEMWGASPHAPRVERELRMRELNAMSDGDIAGGFYGFKKESSTQWPFSSSAAAAPLEFEARSSTNFDHKESNDTRQLGEEPGGQHVPDHSEPVQLDHSLETTHSTQPMSERPEVLSQKTQESSNSPEKSAAKEASISYSLDDPVVTNDSVENLKSVEDRNGAAKKSIIPDNVGDHIKPAEESSSDSSKQMESGSVNISDITAIQDMNINHEEDHPVVHNHASDHMEELKSVEDRQSKEAEESKLQSGKYPVEEEKNNPFGQENDDDMEGLTAAGERDGQTENSKQEPRVGREKLAGEVASESNIFRNSENDNHMENLLGSNGERGDQTENSKQEARVDLEKPAEVGTLESNMFRNSENDNHMESLLGSNGEQGGRTENSKQEASLDLVKQAEGSASESSMYRNSDKEAVNEAMLQCSMPVQENKGDTGNITNPVETTDSWELGREGKDDQRAIEVTVPAVGQSSNDSSTSAMLPESMAEQASTISSSSSSSPKSVLPDGIPTDKSFSSDINLQVHMDAHEYDMEENMGRNTEHLTVHSVPNPLVNAQHAVEHSTDYSSLERNTEELSTTRGMSSESVLEAVEAREGPTTITSNENAIEMSKSHEEIDLNYGQDILGESGNSSDHATHADKPATARLEENSTGQAGCLVHNGKDSAATQQANLIRESEGESKITDRQEGMLVLPSGPGTTNSESGKHIGGDALNLVEHEANILPLPQA